MKKDANKSSKGSTCSIISKMPQSFSKGALANDYFDDPLADKKSAATEIAQRVLNGVILPISLSIKDFIEVNKNSNHNLSKDKKDITIKIARLRKK